MEKSISAELTVKERDIGFLKGSAVTAAGFFLALTKLFGLPAPFAAASISVMNGFECVFMFVGAAAGYVINGGLEICVPYVAAMGALTLIRLLIGLVFPHTRSEVLRIIQSALAGGCVFAANIVTAGGVYEIFLSAAFAVISTVYVYCADRIRNAGINGIFAGHKAATSAAVCILFILITAAVTSLELGVLNIGVFISVLAVLYSSEVKSEASSAVCAVLSSAGIAAGNPDFAASCIMISVTAPVIMLLEKYGRITKACVFILTVGLGLIITGMTQTNSIAAISAAAAAVVYMAVPERYAPFRDAINKAEIRTPARPYAAFGQKLGSMGDTIDEMRSAVIRTSKALENENIRDISWVYNKAADNICKNCRSNMKCWGQLYNETTDIMNKAAAELRSGHFVSEDMLGAHLLTGCSERTRLAAELNRQYAVYCSAESASRKVSEMRNVLTGQLSATGTLLKKMSEELGRNDAYDEDAAAAAEKVFESAGLTKVSVIALIIGSRLSIDAYGTGELTINEDELADRLTFTLRRELDLPMITVTEGKTHVTISERARYDAQVKLYKRSKTGSRHSGDCAECFNDGRGNVYMILSDGMGTGSRARIDSAFSCGMLSKLLKAGIDLEPALEMLNGSLLVKSTDESFATLDLCRIDLNTGDVLLCKAGGASTYVRCADTFAKIAEDGMPLGVGFEADYKGKIFRISEGDVIIMTSDGAEIDDKWLEQLVMRDKHADIEKIVETAGEALRLSSDKETEDDMTIIGVKLIR